ncbi:hypothetical protein HGI15_21190, partial [Modestobacter lapidis]|nr:hypothetical protein [Modestobacter lapidis]
MSTARHPQRKRVMSRTMRNGQGTNHMVGATGGSAARPTVTDGAGHDGSAPGATTTGGASRAQRTPLPRNFVVDSVSLPEVHYRLHDNLVEELSGHVSGCTRLSRFFERSCDSHPSGTALECEGERISYADLDARANRLA